MKKYPISQVKLAFQNAILSIPDCKLLPPDQIGTIVDRSIKSLFQDLMEYFNMKPNVDYILLSNQAPAQDFKVVSTNAQEILEGLFEGKIEIVKAHLRKDKNGYFISVPAYTRKKSINQTFSETKEPNYSN